ncbi:MAG: peptidase M28, partial [Candidatus Izemoplasmatales bacterium]|nr:peptidase M28 [Candidatus Izemoplasmatales bacterium]
YILRGGTDAGKIHLSHSGCPSIALTIPTRYIHSHSSILHMDDVTHSIRLITELVHSLDATCVRTITED